MKNFNLACASKNLEFYSFKRNNNVVSKLIMILTLLIKFGNTFEHPNVLNTIDSKKYNTDFNLNYKSSISNIKKHDSNNQIYIKCFICNIKINLDDFEKSQNYILYVNDQFGMTFYNQISYNNYTELNNKIQICFLCYIKELINLLESKKEENKKIIIQKSTIKYIKIRNFTGIAKNFCKCLKCSNKLTKNLIWLENMFISVFNYKKLFENDPYFSRKIVKSKKSLLFCIIQQKSELFENQKKLNKYFLVKKIEKMLLEGQISIENYIQISNTFNLCIVCSIKKIMNSSKKIGAEKLICFIDNFINQNKKIEAKYKNLKFYIQKTIEEIYPNKINEISLCITELYNMYVNNVINFEQYINIGEFFNMTIICLVEKIMNSLKGENTTKIKSLYKSIYKIYTENQINIQDYNYLYLKLQKIFCCYIQEVIESFHFEKKYNVEFFFNEVQILFEQNIIDFEIYVNIIDRLECSLSYLENFIFWFSVLECDENEEDKHEVVYKCKNFLYNYVKTLYLIYFFKEPPLENPLHNFIIATSDDQSIESILDTLYHHYIFTMFNFINKHKSYLTKHENITKKIIHYSFVFVNDLFHDVSQVKNKVWNENFLGKFHKFYIHFLSKKEVRNLWPQVCEVYKYYSSKNSKYILLLIYPYYRYISQINTKFIYKDEILAKLLLAFYQIFEIKFLFFEIYKACKYSKFCIIRNSSLYELRLLDLINKIINLIQFILDKHINNHIDIKKEKPEWLIIFIIDFIFEKIRLDVFHEEINHSFMQKLTIIIFGFDLYSESLCELNIMQDINRFIHTFVQAMFSIISQDGINLKFTKQLEKIRKTMHILISEIQNRYLI